MERGHPTNAFKYRTAVLSDQDLLDALSGGDLGAFDELYRRASPFVYRVALRVCGHEGDAADVAQDAFVHVFEKVGTLRLSGRLTTYLYPVTSRLARRAREKAGRHRSDADALEAAVAGLAAPELDVSEDSCEDLAKRLAGLPEPQREAVLLRFADGLDVRDAAAALGVPEGTVRSRVHNALKALRAQ